MYVSVCVFSGDYDSVGDSVGALLALPETAECMNTHTHIKFAENDFSMMGVSQPEPGRAKPSGSKTLHKMTR